MNKTLLWVSGTALVASSAGAVVGYIYAKHQLEEEYNKRFNDEMNDAIEQYERHNKEGRYSNLEELAAERLPRREPRTPVDVDQMDPRPYERPDISDEDLARAVVHLKNYDPGDDPDGEDWENKVVTVPPVQGEDTTTDRDAPYIISVEVWKAKEKDYTTPQLFYYSGNQILTDSDNDVIDIPQYLGSMENLKFGYMSNHENWVYIRNDELCCDFEVEKIEESYEG